MQSHKSHNNDTKLGKGSGETLGTSLIQIYSLHNIKQIL